MVYPLEEKYIGNIKKLNPASILKSSRESFNNSKEGKDFKVKEKFAKEGLVAGYKYWWSTLSTTQKVIFISIALLFIFAMIAGNAEKH